MKKLNIYILIIIMGFTLSSCLMRNNETDDARGQELSDKDIGNPVNSANKDNSNNPITPDSDINEPLDFNSGLLLGLKCYMNDKPSYRTLWIAPRNNKLELICQDSFILNPYKDSFWIVDAIDYNDDIQYLVSYKAGTEPQYQSFQTEEDSEEGEYIVKGQAVDINYVGRDYLSYWATHTGQSVGASHGEVTDTPYVCDLSTLEGVYNEDIFDTDINQQILNYTDEVSLDDDAKAEGWFEVDYFDPAWDIFRSPGEFIIRVGKPYQLYSRWISYFMKDTPIKFSDLIDGYGNLIPSMDEIRKIYENARDAISNEDFIAILESDKLRIHSIRNGIIGDPVLNIDISEDETIIMAEWADKEHVERWSDEIKKFLKQ